MCGFKCHAIQQSDQKRCDRCDLLWDMNDPDPPKCKTNQQVRQESINDALDKAILCTSESFKRVHVDDIKGLIEVAELVADGNFNQRMTIDLARTELTKIKELLS